MALEVGESYTDKNGTKVIQGALTRKQEKWLGENYNKSIDAITCLPLTPAQKLYLALCKNGFNLPKALESCDLNKDEAAEAQQALKIHDTDGVVTKITRPTFVGAALQRYDLQGADLWKANLRGANLSNADLAGTDLWGTDLQGAQMQGAQMQGAYLNWANLYGADLSLTDLSGANFYNADFYNAENLNTVILTNAFYDAENPPKNLPDNIPDNIKDNLLALDKKSYGKAKQLQAAYQEALVSDNEEAITAAEKALTKHLEKCRVDNAKEALQKAALVLGKAATLSIVFKVSAVPAVTVTGALPATTAAPSGQPDVSLGSYNQPTIQTVAEIEVSGSSNDPDYYQNHAGITR